MGLNNLLELCSHYNIMYVLHILHLTVY